MTKLHETIDKCMIATKELFPSDRCIILCELLKTYGYSYKLKRGYVNTELCSVPVCCTYLWLENEKGDTIKPIKCNINPQVITERIMAGVRCIDDSEPLIIGQINNAINNPRAIKKKYSKLIATHCSK